MEEAYTFGTASLQIFLLMLGAFLLGALACFLSKKIGLCCRYEEKLVYEDLEPSFRPLDFPQRQPLLKGADQPDPSTIIRRRIEAEQPAVTPAPARSSFEARLAELGVDDRPVVSMDATTRIPSPAKSFAPPPPPMPAPAIMPSVAANLAKPAPLSVETSKPFLTSDDLDWDDEHRVDDLKKLEGIGATVESLLNAAGIKSYAKLATMDRDALKEILEKAGSKFKMYDPKSWPYQAELAAKGNWERLKEYQDFLASGRNG
ncbi:hypothetical protein [Thiolinea disciformis]|uniref:hypothetical protein n=1 Tax=Thiolinea disciformis TaxID=125614 RepID=UPI0012FF2ED2|nr:hypothetical protein [Thiolinea disciformis]